LKRCEKCGLEVKIRDAAFCPVCGGRLVHFVPKLDIEKRFLILLAALMLSVTVTLAGVMENVPQAEANSVENQYRSLDNLILAGGIQYIFGNNMIICLFTLIPLLGPVNVFYVLYQTGRVLAALSAYSGLNPLMVYAILWTRYIHTWLEYGAVSLALSESITLSYYLLRYGWHGFRTEARNVPLILTICVVMLFFAAITEMAAIII